MKQTVELCFEMQPMPMFQTNTAMEGRLNWKEKWADVYIDATKHNIVGKKRIQQIVLKNKSFSQDEHDWKMGIS